MSYPPNQGGYPGYPPPSHSPQPGFAPPPGPPGQYGAPSPYPPQSQQQGHWGQPQGGYQSGYGGAPPPHGQPQHPQHQEFNQYSQHHGNYPPGPPQNQSFPQQHVAPQQGQFQGGLSGPPARPSPGYDLSVQAQGNASVDADKLRGAMKGFGTDEKALIAILSKPDPLQMRLLTQTYAQRHPGRNLEHDIGKETSGYFREGLLALVRGPLFQDVNNVNKSIKGLGTKESVMNDVLLGRSNADLHAIKQAYHETYHRALDADVKNDLSLKTERLFSMVLAAHRAEESAPIIPHEIDRAVEDLHRSMEARVGTDQITVCSILSSRSDGQIRTICQAFHTKYHISLEDAVSKEFSGHMRDALVLMVRRATDRAMSDAVQLEDAMKGIGTKDDLLVNRVVRVHWDYAHKDQVKRAYAHRYKKDLIDRIKGETRGDQERLLIACLM